MSYHLKSDRRAGTRKPYDRIARTVCGECSVCCGLVIYLKDEKIVDIHGDDDNPVSRGRLCSRGLTFGHALNHPSRITFPLARKKIEDPLEVNRDWDDALDDCAENLRKIRDQYGPESIAIGFDENTNLEFTMAACRFAGLLGVPQVYSPAAVAQSLQHSTPRSPTCMDWIHSKTIFLVENDLAATHPVSFGWLMDAQRAGAKIIVADPLFNRSMAKADITFRIMPKSGNLFGIALAKLMIEQQIVKSTFISEHFSDPKTWMAFMETVSWDDLEKATLISRSEFMSLIMLLRSKGPFTFITGNGLTHQKGSEIWKDLVTLFQMQDIKGGGWHPMSSTLPPLSPDHLLPLFPNGKKPKNAEKYPIKAMIQSGLNLKESQDSQLNILFGNFLDHTWESSHMIFPSCLWPEQGSLCFSHNRTIQWGEKIVSPGGVCRTGLDFWAGLAVRFGWKDEFGWVTDDGFGNAEAFYQWVLDSSPHTKGYSLDHIQASMHTGALQLWPRESLRTEKVMMNSSYTLADLIPSVDQSIPEKYPLFYCRTTDVLRTKGVDLSLNGKYNLDDILQINPETALILGIENGEAIELSSENEIRDTIAGISRMVPPWLVSSSRALDTDRVLIRKKDQTSEQTANLIRDLLP